MAASRGKRIALITGIAAVLAVGLAVAATKDRLLESWYIHQLASPDKATRHRAVLKLGDLKSIRALPHLIELMKVDQNWPQVMLPAGTRVQSNGKVKVLIDPITYAFYQIGPDGLPLLRQAEADGESMGVQAVQHFLESTERSQLDFVILDEPVQPPL